MVDPVTNWTITGLEFQERVHPVSLARKDATKVFGIDHNCTNVFLEAMSTAIPSGVVVDEQNHEFLIGMSFLTANSILMCSEGEAWISKRRGFGNTFKIRKLSICRWKRRLFSLTRALKKLSFTNFRRSFHDRRVKENCIQSLRALHIVLLS